MAGETVYYRFRVRSYTAADFAALNDILEVRELGVETDTKRCKFGDGSTPWNDLGYIVPGLGGFDLSALADGDTLLWNAASNSWQTGQAGLPIAALLARISLRI
jgi:hypothetical protein